MHSSISNSDPGAAAAPAFSPRTRRTVIWLLSVLVCTALAVEVIARLAFERVSRLQQRMREERAVAMRIRIQPGQPQSMLIVGNSVVEEGIDVPLLRQALAPAVVPVRYIVEQTTYLDWYYGLRRMFREGMRPAYVLVGFSAPHLNASDIRGDYSAYYLFDAPGVIDYSRTLGLDLTTTSSLLFAHYSNFFALRSEIRAFLMNKAFPAYAQVLHNLTMHAAANDTDEHVTRMAGPRLRALDALSRAYGSRLIFVVMPTGQSGENGLLAAGRNSNATVLLPVRNGSLDASDFADGFHLNAHSRAIFTKALASELRKYLAATPTEPALATPKNHPPHSESPGAKGAGRAPG